MINLKKFLAFTGAIILLPQLTPLSAADIVIFDAAKDISNAKAVSGKLDTKNGVSAKNVNGINFLGEWDLSKNLDIILELENPHKTQQVNVAFFMFNSADQKNKDSNPKLIVNVPPNHRGEYKIEWPYLPHPEMATKFKTMRNNPYYQSDRQINPDTTKIKIVRLNNFWGGSPVLFKVHKITAKESSNREIPSWYNLSEKEFFPFIDKYGQFKYKDWPHKIKSDKELKDNLAAEEKELSEQPSPENLDQFGGLANGPKFKGTGHFRVEKYNGKWWLITPEGNLFWSHGVVRVTPSCAITPLDGRKHYFENLPKGKDRLTHFYTTKDELLAPYYTVRGIKETYDFSAANIYRKYGENWREKFANIAHKRLHSWGLNTIANSSDKSIFMMRKTPYIDRFEVKGPSLEGSSGWWWPFCDPYAPEFKKSVETNLLARAEQLNDPWCIGFFVDNEIHWGGPTTLAEYTLMSPAKLAAKKAFAQMMEDKYDKIANLNAVWKTKYKSWQDFLEKKAVAPKEAYDDLLKFNRDITEKYFKTISKEINRLAPNKLYMGCRFAGSNDFAIRTAAEYCDAISYNIYRSTLKEIKLPQGVDKPIMIGEFHFGALDRGLFHPGLIGKKDQNERAQAYYDYVKSALEHDNIIGTHWHQFSDQATTGRFDGENFQVGFTDVCDTPYAETIAKIREIGYKLYDIRLKSK